MKKLYKDHFLFQIKAILIVMLLCFQIQVSNGQELQITPFAHAGATAKFADDSASVKHNQFGFNSGGIDLLITSQINDKFTALGEVFTGYRGDGANSVIVSIERLYFKYSAKDYLNVRLGRQYIPMGFWQGRYSQAQFFAPTINAPYAVRTKADKGIIPTNGVGLQIDGENIGKLKLSYYLMVDNTSGTPIDKTTGNPSLNIDNTDFKALTGKLKIEPIENLEIFVSARMDELQPRTGTTIQSVQGKTITEHVDQTYFNAGLVHISQSSKLEYAFEYYNVENRAKSTGTTSSDFMYAYLGYRLGKFTPYTQWDRLDFKQTDPTYTPTNLTGVVVGGRYSIAPTAIIKLEYKFRGTNSSTIESKNESVISLQVAARF
jgi:hypothetical protein